MADTSTDGTRYGNETETTYKLVAELAEKFKERNGSMICRELIGYDLSDPEQRAEVVKLGLFTEFLRKIHPGCSRYSGERSDEIRTHVKQVILCYLSDKEIAKMIDLSCVRTYSDKADIEEMVAAARKYDFGQVSVLQCFIPYTKQLLADRPDIHVVGNVSFPSGSDTTTVKVFQANEMVAAGCDEIDMVMNIGMLRSG